MLARSLAPPGTPPPLPHGTGLGHAFGPPRAHPDHATGQSPPITPQQSCRSWPCPSPNPGLLPDNQVLPKSHRVLFNSNLNGNKQLYNEHAGLRGTEAVEAKGAAGG